MQFNILSKLFAIGLVLASGSTHAAFYHVDISLPSALYSDPNAPFFLDFQLNSGGGPAPMDNTALVGGFSFVGGSATGPVTLYGNVSGDLASSVNLAASATNPYNELFQGFTNGTTSIGFDVTTSSNLNTFAPDLFAVAILDSSTGNPQLPTTAPDGVSLFTLAISSPVEGLAFSGTGIAAGITATAAVPVPAALWLFASGLAGLRLIGKRRTA